MKKTIFMILIAISITWGYSTLKVHSLNYYDLYFEKCNEVITKGEYKNIDIDKSLYPTIINIYISKDEEDAISHVIGNEWIEDSVINNKVDENNLYSKQRIIYKEIQGQIVKRYSGWEKSEQIIIKIPIGIEYK